MEIKMRHVVDVRRRMASGLPVNDNVIEDCLGPLRRHRQEIGEIRVGALGRFWQAFKHTRRKDHANRRRLAVGVGTDNGVRCAVADAHRVALVGRGLALGGHRSYREHGSDCRKNEKRAPASTHAGPNHNFSPSNWQASPPSQLSYLSRRCIGPTGGIYRDARSYSAPPMSLLGHKRPSHSAPMPANVRYAPASSTGRCNTGVKSLRWGFKLQGLTWSFIELTRHFVQIGLRVHRQVGSLRKVLSQQTVGVLIGTALPRTLRIAEVNLDDILATSQNTPSFPFKIKCCVDQLRPPSNSGQILQRSEMTLSANRVIRCNAVKQRAISPSPLNYPRGHSMPRAGVFVSGGQYRRKNFNYCISRTLRWMRSDLSHREKTK